MNVRRPFCGELTTSLVGLAGLAVASWVLMLVPRLAHGYPLAALVALAMVMAVVTLGVALIAEHSLRVRIRLLRGLLHELAEGDFGSRLGVSGVDEVSATMRAADDMAGAFQTRLESARTAERRYRLLFEHSPAGMFRTRPDGRVVDCNPAAVSILGYASQVDAMTRHAASFYADPSDRELVLERLARQDALLNVRVRFRRKDGREIPVLLNIVRTTDLGETYFEGQFLDLSDEETAEPALDAVPAATTR